MAAKTALFTFILGLIGVSFWIYMQQPTQILPADHSIEAKLNDVKQEIPVLSFCRLVAKPDDYAGKIIRLNGIYRFGLHGPLIGDPNCMSIETQTWVKLSNEMFAEIERATEKAYGKKTSGALNLTAIGKFEYNNPDNSTDTWADRVPFRFELIEIVSAERPQ